MLNEYFRYGALTAKVRAMYAYSLNEADYEALMNKKSIGEIISYLKNTKGYSSLLKNIDESNVTREQIEIILKNDLYYRFNKLLNFMGLDDKKALSFITAKAEADEILRFIRFLSSKHENEYFFIKSDCLINHSKIDFKTLATKRTFSDLLTIIKNTVYFSALSPFINNFDYSAMETAVYNSFYSHLLKTLKLSDSDTSKYLSDMILTEIDFINISAIIRLKAFYSLSTDEIEKHLIPFSKLLRGKLKKDILNAPTKDAIYKIIEKSPYGRYFTNTDRMYIDSIIPRFYISYSKKIIRSGKPTPAVVMAYLKLAEIENHNIVTLIESVDYKLSPESIKKYLYIA